MREPITQYTEAGTIVIAAGTWLSRGLRILKFSGRMDSSHPEMAVENAEDVPVGMPQSKRIKLAGWSRM